MTGRLPSSSEAVFLRRLIVVVAAGALLLLVVRLADVLLLAFGSILVAVLLHAVAAPIRPRVGGNRDIALALALILVGAATTAAVWMFGREIEAQIAGAFALLPAAWADLQRHLQGSVVGEFVLRDLRAFSPRGLLVAWAPRLAVSAMTAATTIIIVVFGGIYLAFRPEAYVRGLLLLAPKSARARAGEVLGACGFALRQWLLGQTISMALVGVTTGLGLWLAGVPAPAALGLLAGVGQFVPVIGPAATAIPGLLLALGEGPQTLVWAAIVYLAAVQLESNLFTPFVLRQMAQLPMALTLFAVLALGVALGPLGVLFATPLALVAYVLVRMLYVESVLGERLGGPV